MPKLLEARDEFGCILIRGSEHFDSLQQDLSAELILRDLVKQFQELANLLGELLPQLRCVLQRALDILLAVNFKGTVKLFQDTDVVNDDTEFLKVAQGAICSS